MRQLLPEHRDDVDAYDAYRPADPTQPWLRLNMVTTIDGAITDRHGVSEGLGGEGDDAAFRALRALADGVIVAAGTVRAEPYGPHRLPDDLAERRRADGRPVKPARTAVVSASLDLDPTRKLFTDAHEPTIVLTCESSPMHRRDALAELAEVVVVGDEQVDLHRAIEVLRGDFGLAGLLCEGGSVLNAGLLAAEVVDELCVTFAPLLARHEGPRIVATGGDVVGLRLTHLCEHDGELLARYRIAR